MLLAAVDAHLTYTPFTGCCLNYGNDNMEGNISTIVLTDIWFNVCESNIIFCNQITHKNINGIAIVVSYLFRKRSLETKLLLINVNQTITPMYRLYHHV